MGRLFLQGTSLAVSLGFSLLLWARTQLSECKSCTGNGIYSRGRRWLDATEPRVGSGTPRGRAAFCSPATSTYQEFSLLRSQFLKQNQPATHKEGKLVLRLTAPDGTFWAPGWLFSPVFLLPSLTRHHPRNPCSFPRVIKSKLYS